MKTPRPVFDLTETHLVSLLRAKHYKKRRRAQRETGMVDEPDATDGGRRQVRVVCVFVSCFFHILCSVIHYVSLLYSCVYASP